MSDRILGTFEFNVGDTSDIGAEWDAGYTNIFNLQIVGQRLRGSRLSQDSMETLNTVSTPPGLGCWATCLIPTFTVTDIIAPMVVLRLTGPPTVSGYKFFAARGIANKSFINRYDADAGTLLANETVTTWAAGDELRGEITFEGANQRLKLYRNGVELLSVIDNTYTAGRFGVGLYVEGALSNIEVDHVVVGDMLSDSIWSMKRDDFPKMKVRA